MGVHRDCRGFFGLGHLPGLTAVGIKTTGGLIVSTVGLILGAVVIFDWLFWQYGLSTAMVGHMIFHLKWSPSIGERAMDFSDHNRQAWNKIREENCLWAQPVSTEEIAQARRGNMAICLTGQVPVPESWLGDVRNKAVLCLASGGGQQAPILAAAGAIVTSYDLSENQLARDRLVAEREGLEIRLEQGEMADLSRFSNEAFDLIFHPLSNPYIPHLAPVWRECYRVLKIGGRLLAGSMNPLYYLFEENDGTGDEGLAVIYPLPYAEYDTLSEAEKEEAVRRKMLLTWSHSLEEIIGSQLKVGFRLVDLYESRRQDARAPSINRFSPTYLATLSIKEEPWTGP